MIKKLTVLAACFAGAFAFAEPRRGLEDPANYNTYRSSNIPSGNSQIAYGAYLHKVIISSPSADTAGSTVTFYNASGGQVNEVFRINVSTAYLTGLSEFNFGLYFSTGLRTGFAGATLGAVQAIYKPNGVPQGAKVWTSSFTAIDTSTYTVVKGPVLLHKIMVLAPATGAAVLRVHDQYSATPAKVIAQIDLNTAVKEYEFNVMLSSGITLNATAATGRILVLYKQNAPRDWEYWNCKLTSGTVTTATLATGRTVFGGVVNGVADATGQLSVYDSQASATTKLADIDSVTTFGRKMYDVEVTSGVTVSNVGTGAYTVLYRKLK